MLHKIVVHLCVLMAFACMQVEVLTHAIEHTTHAEHSLPDQHTSAETCGQCIADAESISAVPSQGFMLVSGDASSALLDAHVANLSATLTAPYSARAPPFASNV